MKYRVGLSFVLNDEDAAKVCLEAVQSLAAALMGGAQQYMEEATLTTPDGDETWRKE